MMTTKQGRLETLALLFRFGVVGVIATLIHYCLALFATHQFALPVATANTVGFSVAFVFSFLGHWMFTFKSHLAPSAYFTRFVALGVVNWMMSAIIVSLGERAGFSKTLTLSIMALFIPAFSFVVNRFVVFVDRQQTREPSYLLPITVLVTGLVALYTVLMVIVIRDWSANLPQVFIGRLTGLDAPAGLGVLIGLTALASTFVALKLMAQKITKADRFLYLSLVSVLLICGTLGGLSWVILA